MKTEKFSPKNPSSDKNPSFETRVDPIGQNIESILAYYSQEEQKLSRWQRFAENITGFIGLPLFLGTILLFVAVWLIYNILAPRMNWVEFDPEPFFLLEGIIGLCALLTTVVVLIKQNRTAKLDEQRAHLDLQINLLTEQKTTKLIQLIEELRRDLPMVKNRPDPEAEALKQPTDPQQVLAAMDKMRDSEVQPLKSNE